MSRRENGFRARAHTQPNVFLPFSPPLRSAPSPHCGTSFLSVKVTGSPSAHNFYALTDVCTSRNDLLVCTPKRGRWHLEAHAPRERTRAHTCTHTCTCTHTHTHTHTHIPRTAVCWLPHRCCRWSASACCKSTNCALPTHARKLPIGDERPELKVGAMLAQRPHHASAQLVVH